MPQRDEFCSMCGDDVSGQKRMKNAEGEFCCMRCFASLQKRSSASSTPAPAVGTSAMAAPFSPLNLGIGMASAEPLPEEAAPAPAREKYIQSLQGALTVCAAILMAAVVIMAGLYMSMGGDKAVGPGQAIGAGIIHAVFLAFKGVVFILSLILAIRITGGGGFGYVGPVAVKALGLLLGVAILDFFAARSESMEIIAFGFRGLVLIVATMLLFDLDFFQTMILSLINMLMGWLLAIAMAAVLFSILAVGAASNSHDAALFDDQDSQYAMPVETPDTSERQRDLDD